MVAELVLAQGEKVRPSAQLAAVLRRDWWKIAVLLVFIALIAAAVARHEPFSDEGQPWLLAKDVPLGSLIFHHCRYEGHPCLWYLVLMGPAKLGLPYYFLNIISAAIAVFSVYLVLWYAPFPIYVRALLPFTYFIFFQYGVVARGYVLTVPLLLLVAVFYKERINHPYRFVIPLCLLVNVEIPGAFVALGIFIAHWVGAWSRWSDLGKRSKRALIWSSLLFLSSVAFMAAIVWRPSDAANKGVTVVNLGHYWHVFVNYYLKGCITDYWFVTIPVLAVSLAWFWKRKVLLLFLLPTAFHVLLIAAVPNSVFNQGMFFFEWLVPLWVSFDGLERWELGLDRTLILRKLVVICMLVVICIQIVWGIGAFIYDYNNVYCATSDVAQFIKLNRLENAKVFMVGGQSTQGVLLYFDHNIFYNLNNGRRDLSYWDLSTKNKTPLSLNAKTMKIINGEQPDLVVVSVTAAHDMNLEELNRALSSTNYRAVGPLGGHMIWKQYRYIEPAYSYYILFNTKKFSFPQ